MNDQFVNRAVASESAEEPSSDQRDQDSDFSDGQSLRSGKLIINASCVPTDNSHWTDVGLLNDSRKTTECLIDDLYSHCRDAVNTKPRTYRRVAQAVDTRARRVRRFTPGKILKECRW